MILTPLPHSILEEERFEPTTFQSRTEFAIAECNVLANQGTNQGKLKYPKEVQQELPRLNVSFAAMILTQLTDRYRGYIVKLGYNDHGSNEQI